MLPHASPRGATSPRRPTETPLRRPRRWPARSSRMHSIWMGIAPGPKSTRVIAMAGPSETILKAKLLPNPSHPKALPTLLEAVALWQGQQVRAALCVDALGASSVTSRYPDLFHDP